jgi:hypothetical protein
MTMYTDSGPIVLPSYLTAATGFQLAGWLVGWSLAGWLAGCYWSVGCTPISANNVAGWFRLVGWLVWLVGYILYDHHHHRHTTAHEWWLT